MAKETKPKRARNKIFRRIMLLCYLIALVTIGIFAFTMITFEKRSIRKALNARATSLATSVAHLIRADLETGDLERVSQRCARVVASDAHIDYVVVTQSSSGRSLVHTSGTRREVTLGGLWRKQRQNDTGGAIVNSPLLDGTRSFHYPNPITGAGPDWNLIHIGLSLDDYYSALRALYQLTGLTATVALLVGTLLSWLFTRRFTLPIQALQKHAHRIALGGESSHAKIHTGDEIEDLAESVNAMVDTLEQSKQTIRDALKQQASLREKDVLLREIHHRVKNNMQILSSMIRLQTRRAESAELREVLAESEARIRSMGLLHEKLYQSDSVSTIDVEDYLRSLTTELMRMNTRKSAKVDIKIIVHDIQIGLDTALPCGLIVTELISNSMKYAFPGGQAGAILISVSKTNDGEYSLIVWDNGIGVPEGFDISKAKSLGLRLVTMLSAQLNGELSVSGQRGTRVEIRFKESEYANRY